jgi:hypothetical protein
MNSRHWNESELLDALYGLGPVDGHLDTCLECRARFDVLTARHRELRAADTGAIADHASLARQRRAIAERTEARSVASWWPEMRVHVAGAVAGVATVVLAVLLIQPGDVPAPPQPPRIGADQQLLTDVSVMVDSPVPTTVAAIRGLFEDEGEEN